MAPAATIHKNYDQTAEMQKRMYEIKTGRYIFYEK